MGSGIKIGGTPEDDNHLNPDRTPYEYAVDNKHEDDKDDKNISRGVESEHKEILDEEVYRPPNLGVRHPEYMSPLVHPV